MHDGLQRLQFVGAEREKSEEKPLIAGLGGFEAVFCGLIALYVHGLG